MKDIFEKFVRTMSIRTSSGLFAALPIGALGIVLAVSVAAGMVYGAGGGAHLALAAPLSAGTPANLDGLGTMRERLGGRVGGAAQQDAVPGVAISRISLVIPEGDQAACVAKLDMMPSEDVAICFATLGDADFTIEPASLIFPTDYWD